MKKRSWIHGLLVVVLISGLIIACAKGSGNQKTKITLMQNKVEIIEGLENLAEIYNTTSNLYELEILGVPGDAYNQNLQAQFASSPENAPTIFAALAGTEQDQFISWMKPLSTHPATSKFEVGKDAVTVDGEVYGLPLSIEGYGFIYNKTMFDRAGIDVSNITSIDTLITEIKKLPDNVVPIGFGKEGWFQFMHPWGWAYANRDAATIVDAVNADPTTFSDVPEHRAMVSTFAKLKPYSNHALDSYDVSIAKFANGDLAMLHQGNWAQGLISDYDVSFELGMLPLPQNGATGLNVGVSSYYRVNAAATAEQQAGAEDFLAWIFTDPTGSKAFVDELKVIPVYTGIDVQTLLPLDKIVYDYASSGNTEPWIWGYSDFPVAVVNDFAIEMQKFYADSIDEQGLLDGLEAVWVKFKR